MLTSIFGASGFLGPVVSGPAILRFAEFRSQRNSALNGIPLSTEFRSQRNSALNGIPLSTEVVWG